MDGSFGSSNQSIGSCFMWRWSPVGSVNHFPLSHQFSEAITCASSSLFHESDRDRSFYLHCQRSMSQVASVLCGGNFSLSESSSLQRELAQRPRRPYRERLIVYSSWRFQERTWRIEAIGKHSLGLHRLERSANPQRPGFGDFRQGSNDSARRGPSATSSPGPQRFFSSSLGNPRFC